MIMMAYVQDPSLFNVDWKEITAFAAFIILVIIIIRHFVKQSDETMAYTREVANKQEERADATLDAMQGLVREATTVQQSTASAIEDIARVARNGHEEILERLSRTQADVREVRDEVGKLRDKLN